MNRQPTKVKVIIEEGIAVSVLSDGDVEAEVVDIDPDYEDYEALRKYEEGLRGDPAMQERAFTVAHFKDGECDP